MSRVRKNALGLAAAACTTMILASTPARAQEAPSGPNQGAISITGSFDIVNQYMFRGIRQNSTGIAAWPAFDLGFAAFEGDGGLKSVGVNFGTWNSLHSGDTGSELFGKMWYESDFYATLGFGFTGGSFSTTYTAYTSPNSGFTTVKEFMFRFDADDSRLGRAALSPYVAVAREFDADAGIGQADGGLDAGTYLELGVAPGYDAGRASISFPIKVGLSLGDYYENPDTGEDETFGFFSIAGIVTVPLGPTTKFGSWNLHGGVEYQRLGATTELFNDGDSNQVIGIIGIGFSY